MEITILMAGAAAPPVCFPTRKTLPGPVLEKAADELEKIGKLGKS